MNSPPNVSAFKDRHGKRRYRFRKTGAPTYYFASAPGTEAFAAEYEACVSGAPLPKLSESQAARVEAQKAADSLRARTGRPLEFVYFIGGDGGPIKIGKTREPHKRLASLQTSSARPLRVLALTTGGAKREKRLHHRFAAHRVSGEWFNPHPELLSEIERLANPIWLTGENRGENG